MYGKEAWKALQHHNLAPKKRFGQNFLVHRHSAEAIVKAAKVSKEEVIIEVGVGLGALTLPLANAAKKIFAFEIDSGFVRFHKETKYLPDNVTIIHQDFLKANFAELRHKVLECADKKGDRDKKLKIVANLPYSISNPFIFTLIENAKDVDSVTVMLQKEVAQRLIAPPCSKEYGVPTILLASCATVEQELLLKPEDFYPRPKIDSMVIHIDFSKTPDQIPLNTEYNFNFFKDVVHTTFNQRRKTLANTLLNISALQKIKQEDKSKAKEIVSQAFNITDISPMARPETLAPVDFIQLSNTLYKIISLL